MADLEVSAAVTRRALDVAFGVPGGEVLAVLGPNGAGKSTTAAVIAGLLHADRATVRVGDRTLTDTDRAVFIPVHERRVGLLQQDPLLFPHLSALGNVLFAAGRGGSLRAAGRTAARRRALDWLERLGAAELAGRRSGELSGGQAQRVALARALAAGPDVLLLDEPLAGLDVGAAAAIRAELRTVLSGGRQAVVLITHDLLDVVGLADRVMVLEEGRIVDSGAVADVLGTPRSRFGARIAGVNLVRGVIDGPSVLRSAGRVWHGMPAATLAPGDDAVAVFAPAAVAVFRDEPHGSPRNTARVRITALDGAGGVVRVRATELNATLPALAADITPEAVAEMRLSVGDCVWFAVKTQEVGLHTATRSGAGGG
ncbi:MAG: ATP-binding cassette domain-containing protein [Mycobacterium sp.]